MIGGIIQRVITLGPEGMGPGDDGDGPSFANTIKLIVQDGNDRCAVHVEPCNYNIEAGDTCWWQASEVLWSKPKSALKDVRLRKVGFTYSGPSLDLPIQ